MNDNVPDTTAAPTPPTDDQLIEAEARKWADQAIAIHRRNDLQERVQARFRQMMEEAGIPELTEAQQVEKIAQNVFEQMRARRHQHLAETRAVELFGEKYPNDPPTLPAVGNA